MSRTFDECLQKHGYYRSLDQVNFPGYTYGTYSEAAQDRSNAIAPLGDIYAALLQLPAALEARAYKEDEIAFEVEQFDFRIAAANDILTLADFHVSQYAQMRGQSYDLWRQGEQTAPCSTAPIFPGALVNHLITLDAAADHVVPYNLFDTACDLLYQACYSVKPAAKAKFTEARAAYDLILSDLQTALNPPHYLIPYELLNEATLKIDHADGLHVHSVTTLQEARTRVELFKEISQDWQDKAANNH